MAWTFCFVRSGPAIQRHPSAIPTSRSRPIGNQPSPIPSQFLFQRHCLCMSMTSQIELNLPKTFHLNRPAHAVTPLLIPDVYACDSWTQQGQTRQSLATNRLHPGINTRPPPILHYGSKFQTARTSAAQNSKPS